MSYIEKVLKEANDTKALVIGKDVLQKVSNVYKQVFGNQKALVVTDANIYPIAGKAVEEYLKQDGVDLMDTFVFTDPDLYAEWKYLMQLEEYFKKEDVILVGVGSGVINDLCKLASEHLGKRYMIVGTATSMDGYTAYGASITYEGNKQTFECRAPLAVVFDAVIATKAGQDNSASGYADLIAKVPAGADWIIADFLNVEKIHPFAYDLVQSGLKQSLSHPEKVRKMDVDATLELAEGLIMSGFAMQACQSSRPASGMEHQFSHYWDMANLEYKGKHVSHGFKVGIGTLVSTQCLEYLLKYDIQSLDENLLAEAWPTWEEQEAEINRLFDGMPGHKQRALKESKAKYQSPEIVKTQILTLKNGWEDLKAKIEAQIFTYNKVYDYLKEVGAPYTPEMIGVSKKELKEAFIRIPYMRSRFTSIDLILRAGLLDKVQEFLFGKGGIWEV